LGEPGQSTLIVKNEKGVLRFGWVYEFKYWESNHLPTKKLEKSPRKT
jgi:hypothetical protein